MERIKLSLIACQSLQPVLVDPFGNTQLNLARKIMDKQLIKSKKNNVR